MVMGSRELNYHCWRYNINQTSTMTVLSIFPMPFKVRRIINCWKATFAFWYSVFLQKINQSSQKLNLQHSSKPVTTLIPWKREKFQSYGPNIEKCMSNTDNMKQKNNLKYYNNFLAQQKRCYTLVSVWRVSVQSHTGIMKFQWLLRREWHSIFVSIHSSLTWTWSTGQYAVKQYNKTSWPAQHISNGNLKF